ncbi:MAG: hypothetical protein ACI9MR_002955, partial [Myxococcota bacterium]
AAASNSSDFNDIANSCEKRWCLTKNKSCQDGLRLPVTNQVWSVEPNLSVVLSPVCNTGAFS